MNNPNNFYLILPSNTPGFEGNRANKFRIQLPRTLKFDNSSWMVGLSNIIYPNSWDSLGTHEPQYLYIILHDREKQYRIPLPSGTYTDPADLESKLHAAMVKYVEDVLAEQEIERAELRKPPSQEQIDATQQPKTSRAKRSAEHEAAERDVQTEMQWIRGRRRGADAEKMPQMNPLVQKKLFWIS